jgi:O-antigen ligase
MAVILLKKTRISSILLSAVLLCYFLFSSAELLHVVVGIFKPKLGLLFALVLGLCSIKKSWNLPRPLIHAFLFILGSLTLSAIFGEAPLRSFGYIGVYCLNFCLYFLVPYQILQTMDLDRFFRLYWNSFLIVGLYAASQVFLSLFGIYDPFALQRVHFLARGQAWTYEPSYYALYITAYVMFHNALAFLHEKSQNSFFKLLGKNLLLAVSTSTGLIVTYPVFIGIFSLGALFKNRFSTIIQKNFKIALLSLCLSLALITLLFYDVAIHTLFKFFYFGLSHGSFSARWSGLLASLKVFMEHPLLGVGLGGVGPYLFKEHSVYDFKITTLPEFESFDPTNSFTEILGSLGLIGLLAFAYLAVIFYRAFRAVMENAFINLEAKKMATALLISLIIVIIALQMNQGLFRPYIWIHAAVVYGYLNRLLGPRGSTTVRIRQKAGILNG